MEKKKKTTSPKAAVKAKPAKTISRSASKTPVKAAAKPVAKSAPKAASKLVKAKPAAKIVKKTTPVVAVKAPAKRSVTIAPPASKSSGKVAFNGFNNIVLLASGDELLAAEVEMRLRTVVRHAAKGKVVSIPPVIRVAEISQEPDALAMALYRSFRAMGRGAPTLFLCGGPVAGTPVMIRTDWHNTILTTHNGALGLVTTLLSQRKIPYTLETLDTDKLESLEQLRMNNPEYTAAEDFTLRDVLAPAAAWLLAAEAPEKLVANSTRTRAAGQPLPTPYQAGVKTAGSALGKSQSFTALKQSDGSYLTNLTLDPLSFDQWRDDHAEFALQGDASAKGRGWWKLPKAQTVKTEGLHLDSSATYLHLSPHWAPVWDERFLSLYLPEGDEAPEIISGTLVRHR